MATAAVVLAWAAAQVGVTENPPNSNHVRYWDDCGLPSFQGQPWCRAFTLAGQMLNGVGPVTRSVYVPTVENYYRQAGRWYPIERAQPGDEICYSIGRGHCGFVVSVDLERRTVTAIEGNTSSTTVGSQDNGGGVYIRTRSFRLVNGVGRPAYDPTSPEPEPEEDDMPAASDIVAEINVSDRAWYQLRADGGVRVVDAAGNPLEGEPFHRYRVTANTGQVYTFGPDLNGGVFSYPGLPASARQGTRYFTVIALD